MALQKIPRTLLNTGVSDSSDATAITIDSSENVGIATTSPSSLLHLGGATNKGIEITSSTSNAGYLGVYQNQAIFSINRDGADGSFADTGKAAAVIKMHSADTDSKIELQTTTSNNAEPTTRMTIIKSGNVGVGTTSPSQLIHGKTSSGNAYMRIERASQSTGQVGLQIGGGTSSTDWFTYIPSSSDDLVFFGNSANRVRMLSAGGIAFGTDTAAANALDDYEEGTWTPTFVGATLSTATGSYTKIGNQVTVHFRVITTGGLPSSGTEVRVGGLPFTIGTGFGGVGGLYVGPSNVSSATGGGGTIVPYVTGGEDFIRFLNVDTGTFGYTLMGELEVSANNVITTVGTVTYTV